MASIRPLYGSAVAPATAIRSARLPASSDPIAASQPSICAAVDVAIATSSWSVKIGPCAAFALYEPGDLQLAEQVLAARRRPVRAEADAARPRAFISATWAVAP